MAPATEPPTRTRSRSEWLLLGTWICVFALFAAPGPPEPYVHTLLSWPVALAASAGLALASQLLGRTAWRLLALIGALLALVATIIVVGWS